MRPVFPLLLLALLSVPSAALPPMLVALEGRLLYSNGTAVDGTVAMTFRVYNSSTGGSALWSESQSVQVASGYFDVMLGGVSSLAAVRMDQPLYLSVQAGSTELSPRMNFTHAALAMSLNGVVNVNGSRAGVGTTNPAGLFSVKNLLQVFDDTGSSTYNDLVLLGWRGANIEVYGPNGKDGAGGSRIDDIYYDADLHTFRGADAISSTLNINTSSRRVGIPVNSPVDSPSEVLYVDGNTNLTGDLYVSQGGALSFYPHGGYVHGVFRDYSDTNNVKFQMMMATNDRVEIFGRTYAADNGALIIGTYDNGIEPIRFYQYNSYGGGASQERMRIDDSGNVGIHNSNPASTLDVNGTFTATGTKSAEVETADFGARRLYSMESAEVRFYDEGRAHLSGGSASVTLDPIFAETVEGSLFVSVTPYGPADLYIDSVSGNSFTVRSVGGEDVEFAWLAGATRKGFAGTRLEQPS